MRCRNAANRSIAARIAQKKQPGGELGCFMAPGFGMW